MRRTSKALSTVAAASAIALLGGGLALADNVQNNVALADGVKLRTVTAGTSTTVSYLIQKTADADEQGGQGGQCDVGGNNRATVTPQVPTGVTASPTSLTFNNCDTPQSVSFTATAAALTGGNSTDHVIPVTVSGGNATLQAGPGTFTLRVTPAAVAPPADNTPPVVTVPDDITDEATGPDGAVVTFEASALDAVDGALTPSCVPASGSTFALGATTVTCSATDAAGKLGTATFTVTVEDTTPPFDIVFSETGVQDGASYLRNFVPAAPTCTARDLVTAVPACVVTGYSADAGTHTLTATATDGARNKAMATISYTVRTLTLSAFGAPVDGNGVLNTVKGGSTVPLKFTVFDGTTERIDTAVVSSFSANKISCPGSAPVDPIDEFATTGGTALRYSDTQFIQNWKTPTGKGTCYRVTVTTVDGSTTSALFQLK